MHTAEHESRSSNKTPTQLEQIEVVGILCVVGGNAG